MCFLQFLLVSKSLFNPSSLSHFFKSIFLSTSYTLFCLITFIIKLSLVLNHIMETVELKVEMVGIHEKRLRKCLSKLRGIEKVEVDGNSQKVVVTGYAHRNKILKAVRRSGLKAEFWSPQNELLHAYASATSYHHLRFNNFSFF